MLVVLTSKTAFADLPQEKRVNVGGEIHACYDLPQYKELLKLDLDFQVVVNEKLILEKRLDNSLKQTELYKAAAEKQKETVDLYFAENERLYGLWKEENKKRHIAENKPMWGSWLSWGIAGAAMVATASMTTAYVLK